jgi:hypothetical protein
MRRRANRDPRFFWNRDDHPPVHDRTATRIARPRLSRGDLAEKREDLKTRMRELEGMMERVYIGSSSAYYDYPDSFNKEIVTPWLRMERQLLAEMDKIEQIIKNSGLT